VLASDQVAFTRTLISEPYQTRWTDTQLLGFISQCQADVATKVRPYEGRIGIQLQPPQQEYAFKEPIPVGVLRVYIVGPGFMQRLPYTTIADLEGEQIRMYDQSAPNNSPQWLVLPPAPYPVQNCQIGTIGYSPLPMQPGQRPEYYMRGKGIIGITYPPISAYTLVTDIWPMPTEIQTDQDQLPFDYTWKTVLGWGTAMFAYSSDQSVGSDSLAADAERQYEKAIAVKMGWVSDFNDDDPQGPRMLTHRSFYMARSGSWGDDL
jgi:hypothetical protein